jgi:hypothetical protein
MGLFVCYSFNNRTRNNLYLVTKIPLDDLNNADIKDIKLIR